MCIVLYFCMKKYFNFVKSTSNLAVFASVLLFGLKKVVFLIHCIIVLYKFIFKKHAILFGGFKKMSYFCTRI